MNKLRKERGKWLFGWLLNGYKRERPSQILGRERPRLSNFLEGNFPVTAD